jgi:hypothetical protein
LWPDRQLLLSSPLLPSFLFPLSLSILPCLEPRCVDSAAAPYRGRAEISFSLISSLLLTFVVVIVFFPSVSVSHVDFGFFFCFTTQSHDSVSFSLPLHSICFSIFSRVIFHSFFRGLSSRLPICRMMASSVSLHSLCLAILSSLLSIPLSVISAFTKLSAGFLSASVFLYSAYPFFLLLFYLSISFFLRLFLRFPICRKMASSVFLHSVCLSSALLSIDFSLRLSPHLPNLQAMASSAEPRKLCVNCSQNMIMTLAIKRKPQGWSFRFVSFSSLS